MENAHENSSYNPFENVDSAIKFIDENTYKPDAFRGVYALDDVSPRDLAMERLEELKQARLNNRVEEASASFRKVIINIIAIVLIIVFLSIIIS